MYLVTHVRNWSKAQDHDPKCSDDSIVTILWFGKDCTWSETSTMIYLIFGLHPDTWEWVELSGYGDLPPPRDFAAGASVGNGKLVMCVLSLSLSLSLPPLQYTKAKGIEATHSCYWSAPNSMRLYGM
jgi:hypothetical protein